ncbi:MAG: Asp-tRNA(Asn)/Glu-tRNA(Gln) amidotransferase subunit GatB [Synergistaceae bacterium]|nr:Asp-tRNA(Asn)/Glu-tRNA(Gln) amidotransferase subunit GatB [Synergistaceae bacterium]
MSLIYTPVIGLEVHVQLKTKTKIFCPCSADYSGDDPNSHICPVCMGLPGAMPVFNRHVAEQAIIGGLALNCKIHEAAYFSRKAYYYADMTKNFQISQDDLPIAYDGHLDLIKEDGGVKRVRINRLHIEEDVGKLSHGASDGRLEGSSYSNVDYNRAGMPLAEIVSEPDMSSAREALDYAVMLRRVMRYCGASDADMEKGMMRVDANVSVKCSDGRYSKRVEVKNMNSFRALERAIDYEIKRHIAILERGEQGIKETRHWNDASNTTSASRVREANHKFIVEPDLPALRVPREWVAKAMEALPEMPKQKWDRFRAEYGLSAADAGVLTESPDIADYFESCIKSGANPMRANNWVRTEVLRAANESATLSLSNFPVKPEALAELLIRIDEGKFSTTLAKQIFESMCGGKNFSEAVRETGASEGGVSGEILSLTVGKILDANRDVAEEINSGKDTNGKKIKFLQGLVMRELKGQTKPDDVEKALKERLKV